MIIRDLRIRSWEGFLKVQKSALETSWNILSQFLTRIKTFQDHTETSRANLSNLHQNTEPGTSYIVEKPRWCSRIAPRIQNTNSPRASFGPNPGHQHLHRIKKSTQMYTVKSSKTKKNIYSAISEIRNTSKYQPYQSLHYQLYPLKLVWQQLMHL